MKTIFRAADNAELIQRINKLNETTPALWGKMTAAQMLAHMQVGMNHALGQSKNYRHWTGRLFGAISKSRMLKAGDFDRNMPAFKQAVITDIRYFEDEKIKLIALINFALVNGRNCLVKYPHPYFGKFKNNEWDQLNWKHFDHHLRQFGL